MNANKYYDLFYAPARYLNYLMPLPAFPLIKLIKQISNTRSKSQTMRTNLILFSHLTLLPASNRAPKSDRDGFVQSTILHPQYTYIFIHVVLICIHFQSIYVRVSPVLVLMRSLSLFCMSVYFSHPNQRQKEVEYMYSVYLSLEPIICIL